MADNNSCQSDPNDGNRSDPQTDQIRRNYSSDADIDSYSFYSAYNQTTFRQFNGQSSYQTPLYQFPNRPMAPNRYYSQSSRTPSEDQIREQLSRSRRMIENKSEDNNNSNEFKFSLITYNILSQNLLDQHNYLYQHCHKSELIWPKRGQLLVKELIDCDCDIICLQEVHSYHFHELLMPALKRKGYNSVYKQRTGGKLDGCAILYKEDKFSLLKAVKLDFMRQDLSPVLDRDNIAVIVQLKPKNAKTESNLIVANTHLLFNPKRGDIKLAQIRLMLAEIDKIALISERDGALDYNPIILCGDMNSEPNSLIYKFLTKGLADLCDTKTGDISGQKNGNGRGRPLESYQLKMKGISIDTRYKESKEREDQIRHNMSIKHNFKLKSVITRFEDKFGNKLISTSNSEDSSLVDYIFYDYKKLRLQAFQRLLTDNELQQIGNIPNKVLGSDHLSLKAIFSIL